MEKKYCVYKHTNKVNQMVYIGVTGRIPNERWRNGKGYSHNTHFDAAIKKYGWENFDHEILYSGLSREEAEKKEKELIAIYKSNNRKFGYNIENGGHCNEVSAETRQKISKALIGKKASEETREKLRKSHQGNSYKGYGRHLSEETKKKIGEANKGNKNGMFGKKLSEETKRKIGDSCRGEKHYNWGKHRSEETKKKLREAHSRPNNKHRKSVVCAETGIVYPSIIDAHEQTGVSKSGICLACNGKQKSAGGYSWRFATVEDLTNNNPKSNFIPKSPYNCRTVQCIETGTLFYSLSDAAKAIKRDVQAISAACRKANKTAGGYHWRYVDTEEHANPVNCNKPLVIFEAPLNCKKVKCVETGEEYPSIAEAARQKNSSKSSVWRACQDSSKIAGGYHWEYVAMKNKDKR